MGKIECLRKKELPLILLTGCINPSGMAFTEVQDDVVRLNQYCDSIRFYLHETPCKILFVENSGTDISFHFQREIEDKRLEVLTFQGNTYNKELGKGYGEMMIISYALLNSVLVRENNAICKITGRYKVLNINSFLNYYMTCEATLMVELLRGLKYSDSRLFLGTVDFYKDFLIPFLNKVNDTSGFYFEHALCLAVLGALQREHTLVPFKYKPRYSGQSGTDGTLFNHSYLRWYPRNIIYLIRHKLCSLLV